MKTEGGDGMALDVKIIQHNAFLEVVITGTYDMQEVIDRFPYILSTCRLTGLLKVLIDIRNATGTPAATEKIIHAFKISDLYNNHISTGGQALFVAYVCNAHSLNTYEPGKKIAEDNDLPFGLFTNLTEAHEWLGIKST